MVTRTNRRLLSFTIGFVLVFAVVRMATATALASPCGLRLNPPQRGEIAFRIPPGGHALRRVLAGRFLLCSLTRRDGSLLAKLHFDRDGNVLGVAFYRHNGALMQSTDATYLTMRQAPAHVECGSTGNEGIGSKFWKKTRKWWIGKTAPGLKEDVVVKAVRAAQSEWTNNINYCGIKDTANPPMSYQGRSSENAVTDDNKDVVGWGSLENDQNCSQALACTFTWYDENGVPIESDIRFNTAFKWSTNGAPGTIDIQTIAAHEIGHVLQLDHVTSSNGDTLLMWPYFQAGDTSGRKLGHGEALADNAHY